MSGQGLGTPCRGRTFSHSGERKGRALALEITAVQLGQLIPQTVNLSWQCKHCPSSEVGADT